MQKTYNIFTQRGDLYEVVRISGKDEEDCQDQINRYVDLHMDCYSEEVEQPRRKKKAPKVGKRFQSMLDALLPEE